MIQTVTETQNLIETLQTSPMYNLSLCSREEFHSAFLVWFLNLNIKEHIKIFFENADSVTDGFIADREVSVKESSRLDIAIGTGSEKRVRDIKYIIENKFKSIPAKSQLQKYDNNKELQDVKSKLLLTFMEAFDKYDSWEVKTYKEIVAKIRNLPVRKDPYEAALIHDYCKYVELLYAITEKADVEQIKDHNLFAMIKNYEYMLLCNRVLAALNISEPDLLSNFLVNASSPKGDRLYLQIINETSGKGLGIEFYHDSKKDLVMHNFILKSSISEDELKEIFANNVDHWLTSHKHEMEIKTEQEYSSLGNIFYIKQCSKNDGNIASQFLKAKNEGKVDEMANILSGLIKQIL